MQRVRTSLRGKFLEDDGYSLNSYDRDVTALIIDHAAEVLRAAGFSQEHMVIIGGLVPSLIVPQPDEISERHIGTTDLDLCLSLALVEGDTAEYERLENALKRLGFSSDNSFRWVKNSDLSLVLEFFCPSGPDRKAGKIYRPSRDNSPVAKHNMGGKLGAVTIDAGELLTTDIEIVSWNSSLPDGKGIMPIDLRVTGPLAFLIAKDDALRNRDKYKDAYDIIWLIENWPGGPEGAASDFSKRKSYNSLIESRIRSMVNDLFDSPQHTGAASYGKFMASSPIDEKGLARRASGAMNLFVNSLPESHK